MNATTVSIHPGAVVEAHGHKFYVRRFLDANSIIAHDLDDNKEMTLRLSEIELGSVEGNTVARRDLESIGQDEWDLAVQRYRAIRPILEAPARTKEIVTKAAEAAEVGIASIYRWVREFEANGTLTALMRKKRKDAGTVRLSEEVENIVKDVILKYHLTSQKRSIAKSYRELQRRLRKIKAEPVHLNTFSNRIREIAPELAARRRHGEQAAHKLHPIKGTIQGANSPYALIQIDHTMVDIMLVDEIHRISIGRPWITLAIDVFSRMVAGWYISFDPPGTLSTGICITNAVLAKEPLMQALGVEFPWTCQGKPRAIHLDNAREFRGEMLKSACQEYGIDLLFRKVKKPQYGAHIERYLGTLMEEIHALPGTTFSSPDDRVNYDSEAESSMTLPEFERWLANLILGVYHHNKHGEIGIPPLEKYRQGILGTDTQPGVGILPIVADAEKLRIDFLPFEMRTVQPYGVVINNIYYYSDVLQPWIGARANATGRSKRKFIFRYDPRDISYVIFYDPELGKHFRVPYRDITKPAISLWELREIERFLAAQGKKAEHENTIFSALDEMRSIEESSVKLTKKARRNQERRRIHHSAAPVLPETKDVMAEDSNKPGSNFDRSKLKPFEEIEDL